jgi:hypothetical protein
MYREWIVLKTPGPLLRTIKIKSSQGYSKVPGRMRLAQFSGMSVSRFLFRADEDHDLLLYLRAVLVCSILHFAAADLHSACEAPPREM